MQSEILGWLTGIRYLYIVLGRWVVGCGGPTWCQKLTFNVVSAGPEWTSVHMTLALDGCHGLARCSLRYVEPHKALHMSSQDHCTVECD